jgi:hypothetical protein
MVTFGLPNRPGQPLTVRAGVRGPGHVLAAPFVPTTAPRQPHPAITAADEHRGPIVPQDRVLDLIRQLSPLRPRRGPRSSHRLG